jgi:hypothetical protein
MPYHPYRDRSLSWQLGISHRLEKKLHAAGIMTMDDLIKTGSAEAYHRIQKSDGKKLRISYLYAFEGAIIGRHWFDFIVEIVGPGPRDDLKQLPAQHPS